METRYLTINNQHGLFSERVNLVKITKRGALVEVPAGGWFPWQKKFRSSGDRFYVPVNKARKNP